MHRYLMRVWISFMIVTTVATVALTQEPTNEQTTVDQLKIAAQRICPVSGQPLGESPVKVQVGQEHVFLCCQGCASGQISKRHWATIHANFAKSQKKCPVMQKKLPKNPKWTIVDGQIVYVCCPPCTKKIQKDPELYLSRLNSYYRSSLR